MQKKTKARAVGAVHTPCLYKISVQAKRSNLENKKINIDEAKIYEKVVGY